MVRLESLEMVVFYVRAHTAGKGMDTGPGIVGIWETEHADGWVPMDGELTGADGTLEPGLKGLREDDTLPTEYAATVGDAAAAEAFCKRGPGPGAMAPGAIAPGAGAWTVLGADC